MLRSTKICFWLVFILGLCFFGFAQPAHAVITATGEVLPSNPTTWDTGTNAIVGDSGTGAFGIVGGGMVVDNECVLGNQAGATGTVTIDGVGSIWANYNALGVGIYGSASLDVLNGGLVQSVYSRIGEQVGSTGQVTVDGPGSAWINSDGLGVGIYGNATLDITNQGRVRVGGLGIGANGVVNLNGGILELTKNMDFYNWTGAFNFYSGEILVTNGTINATAATILNNGQALTVTGGASGWNGNVMRVGYLGNSTMNISHGGSVNNSDGCIGLKSGSVGQVVVDGNGSAWTCTNLKVGDQGNGTLNITNGGSVASVAAYLGGQAGSTAQVIIDGPGSTWTNSQALQVGAQGLSTIHITNQGKLSVGQLNVEAYGTVDLDGGVLEFTQSTNLTNWTGAFQFTSGEIRVANGGVTGPAMMALDTNQVLNVTSSNSSWTNSTLKVGDTGNGTMHVTGGGSAQSTYGYVGSQAGSTGYASIEGAGSRWLNQNSLHVGGLGSGTLDVTDGAWITGNQIKIGAESGSVGVVTVDGTNSKIDSGGVISVGNEGTGTLNVTNGAEARSKGNLDVGIYGNGTLNVSSGNVATSVCTIGYFDGANGQVTVHDGVLNTNATYLGQEAGATGHVSLDGSNTLWTNQYDFYVGKEGNGTLNITGGAGLVGGSVYIGDRAGATGQVVVEDSSVTINSTSIGGEAGATGQVTVRGSDATWQSSSGITIGDQGSGTLNIGGGATVTSGVSRIGYGVGSDGQVTIDGANSSWTINNELYVGQQGDGTLNVTNGATIQMDVVHLGKELNSIGQVFVDGLGSGLTANHIFVGQSGLGTIQVTNGATVTGPDTIIYGSDSPNSVTVDGPGSTWTSTQFFVGGTTNITNGGTVDGTYVEICSAPGLTAQVTVDGAGSILNSQSIDIGSSSFGGGILNIIDQGTVRTGGLSFYSNGVINLDGGTLELNDNMSFYDWDGDFNFTSGAIRVTNGTVNAMAPTALDTDQVLVVTGSNSVWQGDVMKVGNYGDGMLHVSDGGTVNSQTSYLGYAPGSSGQAVVNDGAWIFRDLHVGYFGDGLLTVEDGAKVDNVSTAGTNVYIGSQAGSTGTVMVRGTGSSLSNHTNLYVGRRGSGALMITDGGVVNSDKVILGDQPGSIGYVMIDGNAVLAYDNALYVGRYGNGSIDVSDGAVLDSHNFYAYLGYYAGSTGTVTVDGSSSQWVHNNNNSIFVGYQGSGTVNVIGGANLTTYQTYLGDEAGSTGHVMVDDALWTNFNELYVGNDGAGSIELSGGAYLGTQNLTYLGYHAGSAGTVTINGNGSEWYAHNIVVIGGEGDGAVQVINQGHLTTNSANLGEQAGSTGQVTVRRGTWISNGDLNVGCFGEGSIHLCDEAMLETHNVAYIGRYAGSTGTVTVDGIMTSWDHYGQLVVGHEGSGTVNVTGHGTLSTSGADLGVEVGSTGAVTIDDATWVNHGDFRVGSYGNGMLNITNNGVVETNSNVYVAPQYSAFGEIHLDNGNLGIAWALFAASADLTGTGTIQTHGLVSDVDLVFDTTHGLVQTLVLNNDPYQNVTIQLNVNGAGAIGAGYKGMGSMSISEGSVVVSTGGFLGSKAGATGVATVQGEGSTWIDQGDLYVGGDGSGTLTITDKGLVSVAGTLTIDYDGDGDSFVNITSGGGLALFGEAYGSLDDFLDLADGTDAIRWWDDSIGGWAPLTTAIRQLDYTLHYMHGGDLDGYTLLTVGGPSYIPGDANGDGFVDGSDATILAMHWQYGVGDPNPDATWEMGDFNGDHVVDGSDATILANHWQQTSINGPGMVPEPSSLVLLITVLLTAGFFAVRKRS